MSRFFFDIAGQGSSRDREGLELPNASVAESEAIKALPGLLHDMTEAGIGDRFDQTVSVRDESGRILFKVALDIRLSR